MDCGKVILRNILGEDARCTLCADKPKESTTLPCSHRLCGDCFKNYAAVVGEVEDTFQCPNGCERSPLSMAKCPAECPVECPAECLTPETENIHNGNLEQKADELGHQSDIESMANVRCSSCDADDAIAAACCDECEGFLCEDCVSAHAKLRRLMKSHHVVMLEDLVSGKAQMKPKAKKCSIHPDEKLTFFCKTCRFLVCPQCAVLHHPNPEHACVEITVARKNFGNRMTTLVQKCDEKLTNVNVRITDIEKSKRDVDLEIGTIEQIINSAADQLVESVNANRRKLMAEVGEIRASLSAKIDRIHDVNRVVADRLRSAKHVIRGDGTGPGMQLEHQRADDFFGRVDEMLSRKNCYGENELENVKEYVRRIGFKRQESTPEKGLVIGEIFQLSEWEVHRQYDLESSVSAMTAFPDGRVAIACEADEEGLMMVLTNGTKEYVLDGVKVKHIHALSDGRFVIIDHENRLRLFSSQGRENPAVYYDHPEDVPKEALPVCVTQGRDHEHILVGFSDVPACYEYPVFGAKPVRQIPTSNVCPKQLEVMKTNTTTSEEELCVIATNSPMVIAVDASGSILWRLEENDASALVPAVFNDYVFIASTIHEDENDNDVKLTIDQYTVDGTLVESLVQYEHVVADKSSTESLQMILLSKAKLAVSIGRRCLVFNGPQSLCAITEEGL